MKVSKKTQKELREKWNENVVTCIGCGIQWAKPGKQCPVCYTPIVELGRNVEVSKNWQKDFDKKFQYALDDGFYVIEEQALKQFIKDLLEKEEKELVGRIEKLEDALIWCSGSEDFQKGGKARKGWLKICRPLLSSLKGRK